MRQGGLCLSGFLSSPLIPLCCVGNSLLLLFFTVHSLYISEKKNTGGFPISFAAAGLAHLNNK